MAVAARVLGTTTDAIRKRVQRGTIAHERDAGGRVWIVLDTDTTRQDTDQDADQPRSQSEALISEMRGRIEDLRAQLESERQAHAEARRIIAGLVERIPPAIEAPSEASGEPESGEEEGRGRDHDLDRPGAEPRSWWRRMFGG